MSDTPDGDVRCHSCGRDAVPRAWITDRGGLYCKQCFDADIHVDETATDVNATKPAAVSFAKLLHWRTNR